MAPTYAMNGPSTRRSVRIQDLCSASANQAECLVATSALASPRGTLLPTVEDVVGGLKTQLRRLLVAWDSQLLGPWLSHRHGQRDESERRAAGFLCSGLPYFEILAAGLRQALRLQQTKTPPASQRPPRSIA